VLTADLAEIGPVDPADPRARFAVSSYASELDRRFPAGFDPARSLPAEDRDLRPPRGLLLLATLRGEPVGCGALKLHGDRPAEIKRMWVAEPARGTGLGRRLLAELEAAAARAGAPAARLETNTSLVEAIALYRASGYVEVDAFNDEQYADHWFEKQLATPTTD
jgi:GNAT superfamily N-acetyltransferase